MSTGRVYQFVDFSAGTGGDTGEAKNAASILPLLNGQPLDATNIGRGPENLRQRTEAIRDVIFDSMYLQDADRGGLCLNGPGLVSWGGSTTTAGTGIITLSDNLYLMPFLTPGFNQTPPVPPVASVLGSLTLQKVGPAAGIVVTSALRSYYQGNEINVTVIPDTVYSVTLVDNYRSIVIRATASTTLSTVIASLNALTTTIPSTTAVVTAALAGGASGSDLILQTQAKQYVLGNVDAEAHTLTPAAFASFFATVGNRLAEGDTLCIAYAANTYLPTDPAPLGGRRQSIPENTNTSVPAGSLFNSRVSPASLVNALPICKVVNGKLVFIDGSVLSSGVSNIALGAGVDPATTTELGLVKLSYAAGTPGTPVVAPLDANGTITGTATTATNPGLKGNTGTGAAGANAAGVEGHGLGTSSVGGAFYGKDDGTGAFGQGGNASGPGLIGAGGTNGAGVQGTGNGTGHGAVLQGGATSGKGVQATGGGTGPGVHGVGGSSNGIGVKGSGTGTGAGADITGGTTGPGIVINASDVDNTKPLQAFYDTSGNLMSGVGHHGLPMSLFSKFEEYWDWYSLQTPTYAAITAFNGYERWSYNLQGTNHDGNVENVAASANGESYPFNAIRLTSSTSATGNTAIFPTLPNSTPNASLFRFDQLVTMVFDVPLSIGATVAGGSYLGGITGPGGNIPGILSSGYGCYFLKRSTDTNWQAVTNVGASQTITDTGVAATANTFFFGHIEFYSSATPTGSKVKFFINGNLVATSTTNLPTGRACPNFAIYNVSAQTQFYVGPVTCYWSHRLAPTPV